LKAPVRLQELPPERNTAVLYSIVMYGRGVATESHFVRDSISEMGGVLKADGFASGFRQIIGRSAGRVALAKRRNRSVIGSMNDLIVQARLQLVINGVPPYETSFFLNRTPMSYIDYRRPRETFQNLFGPRQLT